MMLSDLSGLDEVEICLESLLLNGDKWNTILSTSCSKRIPFEITTTLPDGIANGFIVLQIQFKKNKEVIQNSGILNISYISLQRRESIISSFIKAAPESQISNSRLQSALWMSYPLAIGAFIASMMAGIFFSTNSSPNMLAIVVGLIVLALAFTIRIAFFSLGNRQERILQEKGIQK